MRARSITGMALLLGAAALGAQDRPNPREGWVLIEASPRRPGDLDVLTLGDVAARLSGVRLLAPTVAIQPHATVPLHDVVRLVAMQGERTIGTVPLIEARIVEGRSVRLVGRSFVAGAAEGATKVEIAFPRLAWGDRKGNPPSATVTVKVARNAPGRRDDVLQLPATTISRGSGSGNCDQGRAVAFGPTTPSEPRVDCYLEYASDGSGKETRNWLRLVLLTRYVPPANEPRAAMDQRSMMASMYAAQDSQMALARVSAERGRNRVGTLALRGLPGVEVETSFGGDTLFVLGRTLAVPRTDSMLVVLLDASFDPKKPQLVSATVVPSNLPQDYWGKTWSNGDTTFMIRPKRDNAYLKDALATVPGIKLFFP